MDKKIIGMGVKHFYLRDEHVSLYSSSDNVSLIDGDMLLFSPKFFNYPHLNQKQFDGEQLLTKDQSALFRDEFQYWQIEMEIAIKKKKTIFVFCEQPKRFYFYSESLICPDFFIGSLLLLDLPYLKKYRLISGKEIKYHNKNTILKPLWKNFQKYFWHKIAFQKEYFSKDVYFVPKNFNLKDGESEVFGGIIRTPYDGFVVVLPAINFKHPDFVSGLQHSKTGVQKIYDEEKLLNLSHQLIQHIIQIDYTLKSYYTLTPAPAWSNQDEFKINTASKIEKDISNLQAKIQKLDQNRTHLEKRLEREKIPHRLLFENGKPLREAVINCLKLIGFNTTSHYDKQFQFDVICEAEEGICLGEIEDKDNKAVEVDKISQLIKALKKYIKNENIKTPLKGVIFGNGYRFEEPDKRPNQFTNECIKIANQQNISLVCTTDLFYISQHLKNHLDISFATKCRQAILSTKGVVPFDSLLKHRPSKLKTSYP